MENLRKIDLILINWINRYGTVLVRISIGFIFIWFGMLKYFSGMSPAEDLAAKTIGTLSFGILPRMAILYGLATLEVLIGLGLIFNLFLKQTLILLMFQMMGTFTPVFLFPSDVFNMFPYSLTLEGQYIIKNLVIVSAAIMLYPTLRNNSRLINNNSL